MAKLASRWKDRRQSTNVIDLRKINPTSFSIFWLVNRSSGHITLDTDGRAYDHGTPKSGGNCSIGVVPSIPKPSNISDDQWFPTMTVGQKVGLAQLVFHLIGSTDPSKI